MSAREPIIGWMQALRWLIAGIVVLGLHGLVFCFVAQAPAGSKGGEPAMMIDLDPVAVLATAPVERVEQAVPPEAIEPIVEPEPIEPETVAPAETVEPVETLPTDEPIEQLSPAPPVDDLIPVTPAEEIAPAEPVDQFQTAEQLDPIEPQQPVETAEPVEPDPIEETPVEPITEAAEIPLPDTLTPIDPDPVEALSDAVIAPAPRPRTERPPTAERRPQPSRQAQTQPRRQPTKPAQPPRQQPAPTQQSAGPPPGQQTPRVSPDVWRGQVVGHMAGFKRRAPNGAHGTVRVRFTVDARGRVSGVSVVGSSGNAALDSEAVALVRRASPVPAPPADLLISGSRSLTMPLQYND